MSANYSGFGGYGYSNLYPNWGGENQNQETTPEPDEQAAYTSIDEVAPPAVDRNTKVNFWFIIIGMVLLIAIFSR